MIGDVIGNPIECAEGAVIGHSYEVVAWDVGRYRVLLEVEAHDKGRYRIGRLLIEAHDVGRYRVLMETEAHDRGRYRLASAAHNTYQLFMGTDAPPTDFSTPWATFNSFPYTSTALTAGHTYYFVLREVDKWGISSINIYNEFDSSCWSVEIDGSGNQYATRPRAPSAATLTALAATGASIRIQAEYEYLKDGANAADTWLIYHTNNGVNPDPTTDTPEEISMKKVEPVEALDYTLTGQGAGATVKILLRVRREGTPDVDSESSSISSIVANQTSLNMGDGSLHGDGPVPAYMLQQPGDA